jgi:hypothetical protein
MGGPDVCDEKRLDLAHWFAGGFPFIAKYAVSGAPGRPFLQEYTGSRWIPRKCGGALRIGHYAPHHITIDGVSIYRLSR